MKLELKAKYLHYLLKKNETQGFSWVKLLFLVSLISFFAAIGLPDVSPSRVRKARQAEAKHNISAMNRAQAAYFLENTTFTNSLEKLGVGIKPETVNYRYQIHIGIKTGENRYWFVSQDNIKGRNEPFQRLNGKVFPPPVLKSDEVVMITAQPKKPELKTYIGLVLPCIDPSTGGYDCNHESLTFNSLYESEKPSVPPPNTLTVSLPLDFCSSPGCLQKAIPSPNGFRLLSNSRGVGTRD